MPESPARTGPAWEQLGRLRPLRALALTLREVWLAPAETFSSMRRGGSLERPIAFFVLLQFLSAALWILMVMALYPVELSVSVPDAAPLDVLQRYLRLVYRLRPATSDLSALLLQGLVVIPVAQVTFLGLSTLIAQGMLRRSGKATLQPITETLRALCYVAAACAPLRCFPLIGILLYYVAVFALGVVALRETHEIPTERAFRAFGVTALLLALIFFLSLFARL